MKGAQLAAHAALALLGAALLAWSWGQWPDVQVDFGRELYASWRVAAGDRLYSDLAWFNGPLSVWWNALWFRALGTSLMTLVAVNVATLGLTALLLQRLASRWSGPAGAAASVAVFLTVFAFSRYAAYGNYNFVTPYSHELTHGLVLALGALAALGRLGRGGRPWWAGLAGLLVGLAFLTKAEVFAAGAGAAILRLGLHLRSPVAASRGRVAALFVAAAAAPPLLAWLRLRSTLEPQEALRALAGSWAYLGDRELSELTFYRRMLGIDAPIRNLWRMAHWTLGYALVFGAPLLLALRLERASAGTRTARGVAFALGITLALIGSARASWLDVARPLPVLLLAAGAVLAGRCLRSGHDARAADHLAFVVLAGLCLAKLALAPAIRHYGFALGVPAMVVVVTLVVDGLPSRLEARGRSGAFPRAAALGTLTVFVGAHLAESHVWYHGQPRGFGGERVAVGREGDRIVAGWRGEQMRDALGDLETRLGPDETLLVVPEGVLLNYLLRRRSPTPVVSFMPPELIIWDEQTIVADLEADPPAAVAIVHKDTSEYGRGIFGAGYGDAIMGWIRESYRPVANFGAVPLTSSRFGVQVLVPRE